MVRESATLAVWMSAVRVRYAPPKQLKYEPQVFFIKETFGLVFER